MMIITTIVSAPANHANNADHHQPVARSTSAARKCSSARPRYANIVERRTRLAIRVHSVYVHLPGK